MEKKKRCTKCNKAKKLSFFVHDKTRRDGFSYRCKVCVNTDAARRYATYNTAHKARYSKRAVQWNKNNPHRVSANVRKSRYNIGSTLFAQLLKLQKRRCAICRRLFNLKLKPQVDHKHDCCSGIKSCGKCVRGLLCGSCNKALGLLGDSTKNLEAALSYLRETNV